MITVSEALYALGIDGGWRIKEGQIVKWWADKPQPSDEAIRIKLAELRAEEPMRLLREERDRRIAETDWWVLPDRTASQDQKDYRQALRDLPSTASPKVENDILTNVIWPTKPE